MNPFDQMTAGTHVYTMTLDDIGLTDCQELIDLRKSILLYRRKVCNAKTVNGSIPHYLVGTLMHYSACVRDAVRRVTPIAPSIWARMSFTSLEIDSSLQRPTMFQFTTSASTTTNQWLMQYPITTNPRQRRR